MTENVTAVPAKHLNLAAAVSEPYNLTTSGILYLCAVLSDGELSAGCADGIKRHMEMAASISIFDREFTGSPIHTLSYLGFLEVMRLKKDEGVAILTAMARVSYKTIGQQLSDLFDFEDEGGSNDAT